MKQKGETSYTPQAKYARYSSTPSLALGRKRTDFKQKCSYVHYGFLVVEWIGAHGIPLSLLEKMKGKLVGPDAESGPILKQWKNRFVKENPSLYTCEMTDEGTELDRVKVEGRNLATWIPHAVLTKFMTTCEVRFRSLMLHQLRVPCNVIGNAMCRCPFLTSRIRRKIKWTAS
jgi:hypothetical protein